MFFVLSLLAGLAILPNLSVAPNTPKLTCFGSRDKGFDTSHCRTALRNIVYDSNGRLDSFSKVLFVWYQTCVINIQKPQNLQPNRQWVESTVQGITNKCRKSGGIQTYTEGITAQVYRSTSSNVYQINKPVCSKKKSSYKVKDCLTAMNHLPVDSKGNFISSNTTKLSSQSEATWGECTVTLRTTDFSVFRISHVEVNPAFKRILSRCGSRPGSIYVSGGAEGNNGDVLISTSGTSC